MSIFSRCSRREFLGLSAGALGAGLWLWPGATRAALAGEQFLIAGPASFSLEPLGPAEVGGVWGYNASVPGPVLRLRQGSRLRVWLENHLTQATTVHWHGIRLPNAMDGVPHLTQPPVAPGERFVYDFALPDAGTYWYHPHANAPEQLGRGLSGALIVEENLPYPVDRELIWLLDDWRLDAGANVVDDFGSMRDISHAGRIGNTVTVNGRLPADVVARPGERIRLRLINAANARVFALRFGDLPAHVIALDGQPVAPHVPPHGKITLGPGMRADVVLDCMGTEGEVVDIVDDFYPRAVYRLAGLHLAGAPIRTTRPGTPPALPPNPVPEPDLASAVHHEIVFAGGMRGRLSRDTLMGMLQQGMAWTVNGESHHADAHHHAPLFTLARDTTCRLTLVNDTQWHHPIHLHGHHFRVLTRNGQAEPHQPLHDTVLMNPMETIEIAFRADNPGDWMLHCHVLEHHAGGMGGVFRVQA